MFSKWLDAWETKHHTKTLQNRGRKMLPEIEHFGSQKILRNSESLGSEPGNPGAPDFFWGLNPEAPGMKIRH